MKVDKKKAADNMDDELEKAMADIDEAAEKDPAASGGLLKSISSLLDRVASLAKGGGAPAEEEEAPAGEDAIPDDEEEDIEEEIEDEDEADEGEEEETEKSEGAGVDFYKSLAENDDFVEAVEVSEELEHMVDVLGKGFNSLEDLDLITIRKMDLMTKGMTGLALGMNALIKNMSILQSQVTELSNQPSGTSNGIVGVVSGQRLIPVGTDEGNSPGAMSKGQIAAKLTSLLREGRIKSDVLRKFDGQGLEGLNKEVIDMLGIKA